jgi:nucleotide-binding universal stress UspA family protein
VIGRIVVGVKRLDDDRPVLQLATALASETGSGVQVVHVRERRCSKAGPAFTETLDHASCVVEEAVFELRMAGVGASGQVTSSLQGRVAEAILDQADECSADAIVVGWHKRRGLHGLRGLLRRGDRERLMRLSNLPVILAPLVAGGRRADREKVPPVRSPLAH